MGTNASGLVTGTTAPIYTCRYCGRALHVEDHPVTAQQNGATVAACQECAALALGFA